MFVLRLFMLFLLGLVLWQGAAANLRAPARICNIQPHVIKWRAWRLTCLCLWCFLWLLWWCCEAFASLAASAAISACSTSAAA